MTRLQVITRALRLSGDTSLTSEAADALDDILLKIESIGYWEYLQASVSHVPANAEKTIALSALDTPITDYSRGMWIKSSLAPYRLDRISHNAISELGDGGVTTSTEGMSVFSLDEDTIEFYPTPVTAGLPTLTIHYFKQTTLPTTDGTELSTTPGIPSKYHPYIIDGVAAMMAYQNDDDQAEAYLSSFIAGLQIMFADNADFTPDNAVRYSEEQIKAIFRGRQ